MIPGPLLCNQPVSFFSEQISYRRLKGHGLLVPVRTGVPLTGKLEKGVYPLLAVLLQGACVVCATQLVTALAQGWFRQVSWWPTIVNLHPSLPVSVLQGHLWYAGRQAKWCCSWTVWTVNPAMSWLWRSTSCSWLRPTHWSTQWCTPAEMLRCARPFAASSAACSSAGPTTNLPDTHLLPRRVPAPGSCFLRTAAHRWTPPFSFLGLRQKMGQQKYHPTASSSFPDSVQPSRCMAFNTPQATDLPASEHRDLGSSVHLGDHPKEHGSLALKHLRFYLFLF